MSPFNPTTEVYRIFAAKCYTKIARKMKAKQTSIVSNIGGEVMFVFFKTINSGVL